jgi:hypothetical protein
MDVDMDDWATRILHHSCLAVIKYEDHLRSKDSIVQAKALAKAMRELKETLPDDVLEIMRG